MAPAITHFLVGATLFLAVAIPFVLRYDVDRENAIWLIPLGGVWGLVPDVHHIAPVYAEALYTFHNTPWADLFAAHYTLDRPAVRARYNASVFGSITVFLIAVGGFWSAARVRKAGLVARRPLEHAFVACVATALAGGLATGALWIAISVQDGFPLVAAIVGGSGVLVGGIVTLAGGGVLAIVCAAVLVSMLPEQTRIEPRSTAAVGALTGVGIWLLTVPVALALVLGMDVPLLHLGSLGALAVYGTVFGGVYGVVRGAFSPKEPERLSSLG